MCLPLPESRCDEEPGLRGIQSSNCHITFFYTYTVTSAPPAESPLVVSLEPASDVLVVTIKTDISLTCTASIAEGMLNMSNGECWIC